MWTKFEMYKIPKAINLKSTLWKPKEHLSTCLEIQQGAQGYTENRKSSKQASEGRKSKQVLRQEGLGLVQGTVYTNLGWKQQPESQSVWPSPVTMMFPLGKAHIFQRRSSLAVTTTSFRGCKARLGKERRRLELASFSSKEAWLFLVEGKV